MSNVDNSTTSTETQVKTAEAESGLLLKDYESAAIENLLKSANTDYRKDAIVKALNYLETILNVDDENLEPVSTRALWTAIVASEGVDIDVFLAAILAECITRSETTLHTTSSGFPYYTSLAAKALAEDVVDNSMYTRILQQEAKYQSIAVYRSMYRLANILSYPEVEQELIISEVEHIKELSMSPALYAQYMLVYYQAMTTCSVMYDDFDDIDGLVAEDEYTDDEATEVGEWNEGFVDGTAESTTEAKAEATASTNVDLQKIRQLVFSNQDVDIDELVCSAYRHTAGGIIELPLGKVFYSPQWKQYLNAEGKAVDWDKYLEFGSNYDTQDVNTHDSICKAIHTEMNKALSLMTLDYRIAVAIGIASGDTVVLPNVGECIYNSINGFISTDTGEIINFNHYEWEN